VLCGTGSVLLGRFCNVGCHITCKAVLENTLLCLLTEANLCFQGYEFA
jgi:hypothetical protein